MFNVSNESSDKEESKPNNILIGETLKSMLRRVSSVFKNPVQFLKIFKYFFKPFLIAFKLECLL